jgi:membrane-associated phospholipid phosphatase
MIIISLEPGMDYKNFTLSILSRILTQLLNVPVISGLLLVYFYFRLPVDTLNRLSGFLWALVFVSIIPLLSVFFYIPGRNKDHEAVLHRQRVASFAMMAISYPVGWITLHLIHAPKIFEAMASVYTFVTIGLIFFNLLLHYKASGHAAGVAGPVAAMMFIYGIWAAPLLLLLPLVSWTRVKAKGHSLGQTIVGGVLSFLITLLVLAFFGFLPFQAVIY